MLWVVENLQEELFRSQEYRLKAEKRQQDHRGTIDGLQVAIFQIQGISLSFPFYLISFIFSIFYNVELPEHTPLQALLLCITQTYLSMDCIQPLQGFS